MAIEELSCKELVELVTDYLEEKLSSLEQTRFEAHLATCRGCRAYLSQMRQTIKLTGHLSEDSIQLQAQQKLLQAFRDWKTTSEK